MSSINQRIRDRRTALGLTLLEVAERLGVKEATVQRYESGEIKNIKHETIAALANILKCSPAYIMGWEELKETHEISEVEKALLDRYRVLDEKGKHAVNDMLELQYRRIAGRHLEVVAARNDDESADQIDLMRSDMDELDQIAERKRKGRDKNV